jgi:hypothetical protein
MTRPFLALTAALMLGGGIAAGAAAGVQGGAPAQPAAKPKWVAPIKGIAEVAITKANSKRVGKEIVTTFRVKNLSTTGSIALLRIDEFWYDKNRQPVGGDTYRHKKPLMPGEVIVVTLRVPDTPNLFQNQYQFSHANGQVKTKVLPKVE